MFPPDLIALLSCTSLDDRTEICAALEEIGVEVLRAANPTDVSEMACLDCFALIVVDLDGNPQWASTLRALREQAPSAALVAYSRLPDEHLWIDALEAGAFDFMCKPLYRRDLQRILENALKARSKRPARQPITAEVCETVSKCECGVS